MAGIAAGAGMLLLASCAAVSSPATGYIYSEVSHGTDVGDGAAAATKSGKGCLTSILGWVATGDASIDTAKRNGGITRIAYIDHTSKSILGVYAEYCTVVRGE